MTGLIAGLFWCEELVTLDVCHDLVKGEAFYYFGLFVYECYGACIRGCGRGDSFKEGPDKGFFPG